MGERTSNEMEQLSLRTKIRFPSDLLQRFTASPPTISDPEESLDCGSGEKVELNLGLSLGGRFGVDKSGSKLVRSSSIAAILPVARDDDALGSVYENLNPGPVRSYSDLVRTSSLPVETEEEWRKRKELQSLRRLAAKRRRSDKQRNLTGGESSAVGFRSNGAIDGGGNSKGGGGWLSSAPQFEKKHIQGRGSISGETRSVITMQERCWNKATVASSSSSSSSESGKKKREEGAGGDHHQEEMPCVFTQGDGPNGRLVEGILYKYGRGEQVKIMCVCHGTFLSPAEFVKHAGRTDSLHPLKHILVKPTSSPFS